MCEQLSAYQLWQLLKFGNYLPDQEPEEPWDDEEEIEDNQDIELVIDLD